MLGKEANIPSEATDLGTPWTDHSQLPLSSTVALLDILLEKGVSIAIEAVDHKQLLDTRVLKKFFYILLDLALVKAPKPVATDKNVAVCAVGVV